LIYGYSFDKSKKIKSKISLGAIHAAFTGIGRQEELTYIKTTGANYSLEREYLIISENNKSHFGFISQIEFEKSLTKKIAAHIKIRNMVWQNRLTVSRALETKFNDNSPNIGVINAYMPFLTVGLGASFLL